MKKKVRLSAEDAPEYEVRKWYQFALPGGFLMFGEFVKELPFGKVRFKNVRHMRNAGGVELPEMCASGTGPETVLTKSAWRYLNCTPIWSAPWDADKTPGGD